MSKPKPDIQQNEEQVKSPPIQKSDVKVKVICSTLNVRKGPSKDQPVLFHLAKDSIVTVTAFQDEKWVSILADGDRAGYVMKIFVEPVET